MTYSVGQLATLTGLTVRALHHYDAIGLLKPSHRSDAGYRLYTRADIVCLYRIQALRRLGLPLSDIAQALTGDGALPDVIARQIDELDAAIEHASAVRARLVRLQEVVAAGDVPASADWLAALELVTQYDRYCSASELRKLLAHRHADADEWPRLVAALRAAMAQGLSPASADAQALGERWRRMLMSQVGGDISLAIKLKLAYNDEPELQDRARAQSGLDAAVLSFLTDIWRHGHMALWSKHLDAATLSRLSITDDGMQEWIRTVAAMREAMNEGAVAGEPAIAPLVSAWDAQLGAFAAGDAALLSRMHAAFASDVELQRMWGLDDDVLSFVESARRTLHQGARHA
jgi:DNA-binding transcriptional MerR regulator